MNSAPLRSRAFTLLELLVVILIIGIITAFVVPASTTMLRGSQLNQATQVIVDQFSLARQTALARNHPVELRLIRFADPETPGEAAAGGGPAAPSAGQFRAIQIVDTYVTGQQGGNAVIAPIPVDKPQLLPNSVVMTTNATFSSIIASATSPGQENIVTGASPIYHLTQQSDNEPAMPRKVGLNYDFVYFRFLPDGSTDLPSTGTWFVTLFNINDRPTGQTPPANFFTLQVDPVSGTLKQFRPGI